MRYIRIVSLMVLLVVVFSFKNERATPITHQDSKPLSYFYGGKFANPFWAGHYVKVFVDVVNQTQVVGFNLDNGTLMDFGATGTYSNSGGIRSVVDFEDYDDFSNYYWYTGNLL